VAEDPAWLEYQRRVAEHVASRARDAAEVEHDVRLLGRSGRKRQIDVLVRYRVGSFVEGTIVVDAKRRTSRISIDDVEAFAGIVDDVKAHHGVLVATWGYQKGAKARAREYGHIDLAVVTEEELASWRPRIAHVACDECGGMSAISGQQVPAVGTALRPCPRCGEALMSVIAVTDDRGADV
jgi:hypothetical protein